MLENSSSLCSGFHFIFVFHNNWMDTGSHVLLEMFSKMHFKQSGESPSLFSSGMHLGTNVLTTFLIFCLSGLINWAGLGGNEWEPFIREAGTGNVFVQSPSASFPQESKTLQEQKDLEHFQNKSLNCSLKRNLQILIKHSYVTHSQHCNLI